MSSRPALGWATGLEQNKTVHCEHLSFGCLLMHLISVVHEEVAVIRTTIVHSRLIEAQRQNLILRSRLVLSCFIYKLWGGVGILLRRLL